MIRVAVRFFAQIRDKAGVSELALELPPESTVAYAAQDLEQQFPQIIGLLPRTAFAVNMTKVDVNTILRDGDELALLPPVSGG